MRTIADEVYEIILEEPFLEESLIQGLINLSALARRIRPRVVEVLVRPVSQAALVMALRRVVPRLLGSSASGTKPQQLVRDLTVRSDLAELTFLRSEALVARQKDLLREVAKRTHRFITFTQGVFETTLILDAELVPLAERIFSAERRIAKLEELSAITIRLSEDSVHTPGVHYSVLKQLAMRDINVVEVVSTYTELTVILSCEQVDRAFSVLLRPERRRPSGGRGRGRTRPPSAS